MWVKYFFLFTNINDFIMKNFNGIKLTVIILGVFICSLLWAQDGALDTTYNNGGSGFNNLASGLESHWGVTSLAIQSDGKILAGGMFTGFNGSDCPDKLVRLNSNGTLDTNFNYGGSGFGGDILDLVIQNDGKILVIGGEISTYNGNVCHNGIVRLNSDGTIDTTFDPGGSGFAGTDNWIMAIALQSDGKILVGGSFYTYNESDCPDNLIRLNSDGSLDTTFNPGGNGLGPTDSGVIHVVVQSDGKILAAGYFSQYNGTACTENIIRLNSDGSVDNTFNTGGSGFDSFIQTLTMQCDGKILVGGYFTAYNGSDCPDRLARLNSDGTLDTAFIYGGSGFDNHVWSVAVQSDCKLLVSGAFKQFNGISTPWYLVRLNADGTYDNTFNPGGSGLNHWQNFQSVVIQSDGKILIGSYITEYNGSDCPDDCIRLLNSITCGSPTYGGTIANAQSSCGSFNPSEIASTALPTGHTGTLEYKWQQSTTGSSSGFSDIAGSNSTTYDPLTITQTTWYKRLARVDCMSDWTCAGESNVAEMTVEHLNSTISVGTGQAFTSLSGSGGLFEDINTNGIGGNLIVNITSDLTEDGTHALNQWTEYCGSNYTITIQPEDADEYLISGNVADGMIRLNGADRVTIDGRYSGSGKYLRFRNTNTSNPTFTFSNDANDNTVQYCNIEGSTTNTDNGVIFFSTGTTTGNNNNLIHGNIISDLSNTSGVPANLIYSYGSASYPNSDNTISDNEILNFSSYGINITNTGNGDNWNISGNSFYNSLSTPPSTNQYSIYLDGGSGSNNNIVSGNFIGGQGPNCSGGKWINTGANSEFYGIFLNVGSDIPSSVQGNVIQNISLTGTENSYITGIWANYGIVNIGTITGNIIGHASSTESISLAGISSQGGIIAFTTSTIANNLIANMVITNATSATNCYGILIGGDFDIVVENNKIFNIGPTSTAANQTINYPTAGIMLYGDPYLTHPYNIINNMISLGGDGYIHNIAYVGIWARSSAGTFNIFFNSVSISGTCVAGNTRYSAAFYKQFGSSVFLKDNIFSNFRSNGPGGNVYHIAVRILNTNNFNSDYNDLFTSNEVNSVWGSTPYDFTGWITASANDANSVSISPVFQDEASGDLHLIYGLCGTPITGITTDFDGDIRSTIHPTIGADEVLSCSDPSSGGTIDNAQSNCGSFNPEAITGVASPSGYTGILEYKWQQSVTSSSTGFSDIANSNSETYDPNTINQTTWYKRLARVTCMADWTCAAESNVVEMTVVLTLSSTTSNYSGFGVSCHGSNDGTVNITPSNGTTPYLFNWSGPGNYSGSDENPSGLYPGTYYVTITDNLNCSLTNSVTITEPEIIAISYTTGNETNPGAFDGWIVISVTGGTGPYTYLWSNGAVTQDISNITAGYYDVVVTGSYGCIATATMLIYSTQAIPLNNWCLISTYMNPSNSSVVEIFSGIQQSLQLVKNENGAVYIPMYGIDNIGNISVGKAYQVKTLSPCTLYVTGTAVVPEFTPINIQQGWSFLGYLRQSPADIVEMLSPVVSQILIVKNETGWVYWPQFNLNAIGNMLPGKGYQIKLSSASNLTYPPNSANADKSEVIHEYPVHFSGLTCTGNNMTLGIHQSAWNVAPKAGDEIGIFGEDGQLAGSTVLNSGFTVVTVWGKDANSQNFFCLSENEKLTLKYWDNTYNCETILNDIRWYEGNDFYTADGISIINKISTINGSEVFLFPNTPNPFDNYTTISFYLPDNMNVELSLFNILGEKTEIILPATMDAGNHNVVIDARDYAAGNYFITLVANGIAKSQKISIIR